MSLIPRLITDPSIKVSLYVHSSPHQFVCMGYQIKSNKSEMHGYQHPDMPFFITEMIHYTNITIDPYTKGTPFKISTIHNRRLERARQFEVKLAYSAPAPFIIIQPDTVIITIKDRDGTYIHAWNLISRRHLFSFSTLDDTQRSIINHRSVTELAECFTDVFYCVATVIIIHRTNIKMLHSFRGRGTSFNFGLNAIV